MLSIRAGISAICEGLLYIREATFRKTVRGAIKFVFSEKLGIWPNQRTPSPPLRKLNFGTNGNPPAFYVLCCLLVNSNNKCSVNFCPWEMLDLREI